MTTRPPSDLPYPQPHLGPIRDRDARKRDQFEMAELAVVLSHYDLGVIRRVREYRRGSRRSPKIRLGTETGEYLLKRRAPDREDPERVRFAHALQARLAESDYPVPALMPLRSRPENAMLKLGRRIYEMFRFVEGKRDDHSNAAAGQAGFALGRLHRILAANPPPGPDATGSYHAAPGLAGALGRVPDMVTADDPAADAAGLQRRCTFLGEAYREAAERVEAAGLDTWPRGVIHGDWHPGNLLFRDNEVVAVLDFDSARVEARVFDVANAALQFSMRMTAQDAPEDWPARLDVKRIRALLQGYDQGAKNALSASEREALPWLMIEALILESVAPIAMTGRFGQLGGEGFLKMVEAKTKWLRPRAAKLVEYVTA